MKTALRTFGEPARRWHGSVNTIFLRGDAVDWISTDLGEGGGITLSIRHNVSAYVDEENDLWIRKVS